jgi:hypothetical protein
MINDRTVFPLCHYAIMEDMQHTASGKPLPCAWKKAHDKLLFLGKGLAHGKLLFASKKHTFGTR